MDSRGRKTYRPAAGALETFYAEARTESRISRQSWREGSMAAAEGSFSCWAWTLVRWLGLGVR